jgi:hypothetical protein
MGRVPEDRSGCRPGEDEASGNPSSLVQRQYYSVDVAITDCDQDRRRGDHATPRIAVTRPNSRERCDVHDVLTFGNGIERELPAGAALCLADVNADRVLSRIEGLQPNS